MTIYKASFDYLQHFLTRTFTLPCPSLAAYQQLQGTLGLSEWEFLEAIMMLETRFGVVLPNEALLPRLTVGKLCTLVSEHA